MKCKPTCRVLIISYIKYSTNSQAFTLDLNGEEDIKDLIEDGREFIA